MSHDVKFYFTRLFLCDVQQANGDKQLISRLGFHVFAQLRRYPAAGRLLLNRETSTADIQRLNEQLRQKIGMGELREYCFSPFVLLYLLNRDLIIFLSCVECSPVSLALWDE